MTKLTEEVGAREKFRKHFKVDNVARVKQDPNYSYKLVIYDYPKNPYNFDNHEKAGYEVVYSTESVEDDRSYAPDGNKEEKLRMVAVEKRTIDGYNQVLMRISKQTEKENHIRAHKENEAKYVRSSRSSLRKTKNQVIITSGELDTSGAKNYNPTNNQEGN